MGKSYSKETRSQMRNSGDIRLKRGREKEKDFRDIEWREDERDDGDNWKRDRVR